MFFCQGQNQKSNVLTKSGFTIINWNPIVKKDWNLLIKMAVCINRCKGLG
jgi:hypothetical protein